jgi:Flp pilus assembly protein TadG
MFARRWQGRLGAFWQDRRGNVAVLFGLVLLPLTAAAGVAVDTVLAYTVENELQKSLDAAGLAAGRALDPDDVEADARSFFAANFHAGPGLATVADPQVQVDETGERITITASASMPTRFMRLFGKDSVTVSARTVVNRQTRGMELVLVLDITYSMVTGNKVGGLKQAATDLVNILYGDNETVRDLYVGVVPYIAAVNIGTANASFLDPADRAQGAATAFGTDGWKGCVLARATPYDQSDDPPSGHPFSSYLYPDNNNTTAFFGNDWGPPRNPQIKKSTAYSGSVAYFTGYGPNVGCPTPITPLIRSKSQILAAIGALTPWFNGGTIISEGLAWGWRVASPRWRGLWSGAAATLPLDYGTANMDKVIVLLTDGENQMPVSGSLSTYHAYQNYTALGANQTAAENDLDQRTRAVCRAVKAAGIKLYTITFGSVTSRGQSLMRSCADRPSDYYHSPDNATLRAVFKSIGGQLSNLRLAQ